MQHACMWGRLEYAGSKREPKRGENPLFRISYQLFASSPVVLSWPDARGVGRYPNYAAFCCLLDELRRREAR
jgi:hypothetical protein